MDYTTSSNGAFQQTGAYSYRAPSPPHIVVPPSTRSDHVIEVPTYDGVAGQNLTTEDLRIITQGNHTAVDNTVAWEYGWRRSPQKILPFLYLGPGAAAKDKKFLQEVGITMLLGVRDAVTAKAGLMSGAKIAEELGIEADTIDTANLQALIQAFPFAIRKINNHLLSIYRQQGNPTSADNESLTIDSSSFHTGRVLVYCESGNERSAVVVAAYLMAIYGLNMVKAIQFITSQRFCVAFDEPLKKILLSYQDVLEAQRNVAAANRCMIPEPSLENASKGLSLSRNKRAFSISEEEEGMGVAEDEDRFLGRAPWQPFTDQNV